MGERENIRILLLFFQDFSGLGSMSNMSTLGLIKWGEEIRRALGYYRLLLIMSDDEYGGGGGGDYDYGGPRCVQTILVGANVAELHFSFTEEAFVRNPYILSTRSPN